jgi:adenylate cyclase
MEPSREPLAIRERRLVLIAVDLAGFARGTAAVESLRLAEFLDAFYCIVSDAIRAHGGRVVKFMGDACFAVFEEDASVAAVDAALDAAKAFKAWNDPIARQLSLGANVHLATVSDGEIGPRGDRRYDVIGSGVNHLFRMGSGRGVRISEPVYRQLPSDRRRPWQKQRPPATYSLE